jgi:hypothetical protein
MSLVGTDHLALVGYLEYGAVGQFFVAPELC